MSDLFHKDIPELFVRKCFEVMLDVDRHVYQVLTKRPARAASFINEKHSDLFSGKGLPDHIWIGTSIENQEVDYRVQHLMAVNAEVRFLSCEPLLGPIDLAPYIGPNRDRTISWVIVGGESGPGARAIETEWVRQIRDQCGLSDVAFFFKQWGRANTEGRRTGVGRHHLGSISRSRPCGHLLSNRCLLSRRSGLEIHTPRGST